MSRPRRRTAERNAGPFLAQYGTKAVPMRTLSDDYRDKPTEPEDSDREPEPEPRGLVRTIIDRLERPFGRGR